MRELHLGLYVEHLEDASFLYVQRHALLANAVFPWRDLSKFEARIEAHVDALLIGGELAQEACVRRAQEGDAGELFAALSVFCRLGQAAGITDLWSRVDAADPEKLAAAAEALKFELPNQWQPSLERAIGSDDEILFRVIAEVCGYRRIPLVEPIATALESRPDQACAEAIWALSRLPPSELSVRVLETATRHADTRVRAAAILALARHGLRGALKSCHLQAQADEWPQPLLGLAGGRAAAKILGQRLAAGRATPLTLQALGLLGDLSVVRAICECLNDEALADSAAWALYWITGAPLHEDRLVIEPVVESELFDQEVAAWREGGELPKRADGRPFGSLIRKLAVDPGLWEEWLSDNASRFDPELRYRLGQLYSPRVVLQGLLDESTPGSWRRLACDELSIRFDCPVAIESDWRVTDQLTALRAIDSWVTAEGHRFDLGSWQ